MARMILAPCKAAEQNRLYDNPPSDPSCSCETCSRRPRLPTPPACKCSGCVPEEGQLQPTRMKK
ncbi:uncharacterized protein B0H18DRAFT_1001167, partial [Fomitopsis serialis]|uniref:uncharacterized protein n=1 Tax=Fomitopsis serialis TaxID=139415 RepID=UPI002007A2A8